MPLKHIYLNFSSNFILNSYSQKPSFVQHRMGIIDLNDAKPLLSGKTQLGKKVQFLTEKILSILYEYGTLL